MRPAESRIANTTEGGTRIAFSTSILRPGHFVADCRSSDQQEQANRDRHDVLALEPSSEPRRRRNQFLAVRAVWRYNKHALRLTLVGTGPRYDCCHWLATNKSPREEPFPLLISIPAKPITAENSREYRKCRQAALRDTDMFLLSIVLSIEPDIVRHRRG